MSTSKSIPSPPFYELNKDCFLLIAEYLELSSLRNLSQTCQKFRNVLRGTPALDTRLDLRELQVFLVQNKRITVSLVNSAVVHRKRIDLIVKIIPSNEGESDFSLVNLPPTFSTSSTEETFYGEQEYKLQNDIWINSQDDVARFFAEMSHFVSVEKFILEHFDSSPEPFVWLARIFHDVYPGIPQQHNLCDIHPERFQPTLRPFIDFWDPSIVLQYMWPEDLETNMVGNERLLTDAFDELMDREVRIVHARRPLGNSMVEIKLSGDKLTVTLTSS